MSESGVEMVHPAMREAFGADESVRGKLEKIAVLTRFESSMLHQQVNVICSEALAQLDELERDHEAKNEAYAERNLCVVVLAALANRLGWIVGVARHTGADWEDDWRNIVYIDTPQGQLSWHFHDSEKPLIEWMPPYDGDWDGHTKDEKYERLAILAKRGETDG